jgi:predicted dehydrogenase
VHTVRIGLPTDPSGGNGTKMPVPPNLDYDQWLGCTPEVYYTEDRVHPQNSLSARPGWLRLNQFTRGMITGWGSHHVDIAHWGMDAEDTGPLSVNASAQWPGPESFWNVHGPYSIEMKYPGDVTLLISDKLPNGIRFEGEDGWIWVSRGSYSATASDPTAGQQGSKALDASNKDWLRGDLSSDRVQLHRSPKWDHHLDWLMAVRERKDPTTNVETGHRACTACTVAWIGMKLGRPLKWDPKAERFEDDAEANALISLPERAPYGALAVAKKAGVKPGAKA